MVDRTDTYFEHPVFHPITDLHLDTPAMQYLVDEAHRWIWTGATGALITGAARAGKSTAMQALPGKLYTRDKTLIPVYYLAMPDRDQQTIRSLYAEACLNEKLRVTQGDRAYDLADRFVHVMADKAVAANCQVAVLIVDEMQRLRPRQFNAFAELHDKLLRLDIVLIVIFVGNDQESANLIKRIKKPDYAHIRGRFFNQQSVFLGLTSKNDVEGCLAQYDELRFPPEGPSYTAYFLPEAVETGWRFASLSSLLWRVFRDYQKTYKIPSWGMQYFIATINTLLTDFLPNNGVENVDEDMVHECIRISGLIPSLVSSAP